METLLHDGGNGSTGVSLQPVYTVLEGHFDLIVGNAQHIKAVPGRKTDVRMHRQLEQANIKQSLVMSDVFSPLGARDARGTARGKKEDFFPGLLAPDRPHFRRFRS